MISQWSRDERRRRREEEAAKPHPHHVIMLELMRQLRPHTYGAIYDTPNSVAAPALQKAIDEMAGVITGDAQYFHAKPHSLCVGFRKPPKD
ncbi:hypothetical protein AB8A20_07925 [Tardiphaga sp. 604_B6_N1_1]|uniref:hypothetical protein n=1 Tax=unclassified Tardiphaga TaxID=2631404 RepID=UPI003F1EBBD6